MTVKEGDKRKCQYCGNEYIVPINGELSVNVCCRPECMRKAIEEVE